MSKKYSLSPVELEVHIRTLSEVEFIVEDFLPTRSVSIFLGDSGLGKTPFCMQLAVCIAAGVPFLGMPTQQGIVLYADYENSAAQFQEKQNDICRALEIDRPDTACYRLEYPTAQQIENDVAILRPKLLIVDTLRYHDPAAETSNPHAASRMGWFKRLAHTYGCATLFIHHPKKQNEEDPRPILDSSVRVLDWMQCASGPLAFVNQSDVRIGFDRPLRSNAPFAVIIRGHRRGCDEIGPWKLARILDDYTGDPVAYSILSGRTELNQVHQGYFAKLPAGELTYSEIVTLLTTGKKQVSEFLAAATRAKVVLRTGEHKTTRYARI